jgi:hypothetical protein
VSAGTFRWLLRRHFDTVWLGRPLGEWLIGREPINVASEGRYAAAAHVTKAS